MPHFVKSQKGGNKLVQNEFLFVKSKDGAGGKEIWVCERRATCTARVHTVNGVVVQEIGEHTHTATHGRAAALAVVASAKEKAMSSVESTRAIIQDALMQIPVCQAGSLPDEGLLSRTIRRAKSKVVCSDITECAHTRDG